MELQKNTEHLSITKILQIIITVCAHQKQANICIALDYSQDVFCITRTNKNTQWGVSSRTFTTTTFGVFALTLYVIYSCK